MKLYLIKFPVIGISMQEVLPTREEVLDWMLSTVRHSCQIEYYLHILDIGYKDPQRPHDIVGEGNKYYWPVLKGLALQYRDDSPEFFDTYVRPSIELHRKGQYHHQMWNQHNPSATDEDMKLGAVDTICSLLDNRLYQGGAHSFEDIMGIIKRNEPHKVKWMWMVYSLMKKTVQPDLSDIKSLSEFPNIGLPASVYNSIVYRTEEALRELASDQGYRLL